MIDISFNSCRICLKGPSPSSNETWQDEMKSIDDRDENSSFSYSEKFTMCTGINISTDTLLAKKICFQCTRTLRDSFNFLVSCKKNEIILQNYIHDIVVKNEKNNLLVPPKVVFETPSLNDRAQLLLQQNNCEPPTTTNIINENIEFLSIHKFETVFSEDERGENIDDYIENPISDILNENEKCDYNIDDYNKNYISDKLNENQPDDNINSIKLKIKKPCKLEKLNKLKKGNCKKLVSSTTNLTNEKKSRTRRKINSPKLKDPGSSIVCDICGNLFKDRKRLELHRHLHTGEKNFKCTICNKSFALRPYLRGHMLRAHTGVRKFQCSFENCDQKFYRKSVFLLHEKSHSLERDFECQLCNKQFMLMHHLKRHMRIHSDERPYSCKLCGVSFRRGHHLKQHIRSRAHMDLMEKQSEPALATQTPKTEALLVNTNFQLSLQ